MSEIDEVCSMSNEGAAAAAALAAAWFRVGPEHSGPLIAVHRHESSAGAVWLDVGETVRVVGDASDVGNALYFDVVASLDGLGARERGPA